MRIPLCCIDICCGIDLLRLLSIFPKVHDSGLIARVQFNPHHFPEVKEVSGIEDDAG